MDSFETQVQSEDLQQYFHNTFQERLVHQTITNQYDETMLTPATRILQKQREMAQVEEDLRIQKEEHTRKMEQLQERRTILTQKEKDLADSLLKFDHFLKENDARRKRASIKAQEEREACDEKDIEIEKLRNESNRLRAIRDQQRKAILKGAIYEKFLKKALDASNEFSEIKELIDRFVTLDITNKDLRRQDQACQESRDMTFKEASRVKEEHRVKMLAYSTKVSELTSKKEKAEKESLFWDHAAQAAESGATNRTLLLGRIKMATANLFALVNAKDTGSAALERINVTERQLDKIQVFISDLEDVVKEFEAEIVANIAAKESQTSMGSKISLSTSRSSTRTR